RVDRSGVVGVPARDADEDIAAGPDEALDRRGELQRVRDVLEDVAAHDRSELELLELLEELRIGQVARDVDARPLVELVVENADAAFRERSVDQPLEPRLRRPELGGPGTAAQEWRGVIGGELRQPTCQPGRLRS